VSADSGGPVVAPEAVVSHPQTVSSGATYSATSVADSPQVASVVHLSPQRGDLEPARLAAGKSNSSQPGPRGICR